LFRPREDIGFDIDGNRWSGNDFARAEHELKEGLAKYYTYRVMRHLQKRLPRGVRVYKKLLAKQPLAYHSHEDWIMKAAPERIRAVLVVSRIKGDGKLKSFNNLYHGR
jgi:hypothetical protein